MNVFPHLKRNGFTLIEMMIVIIIIALLTLALALGYRQMQLKLRYDAHLANIERIFQDARTRSLSTVLIDDTEPTKYYLVSLLSNELSLTAYGETLTETIESFTFDKDILSTDELEIYYFPPYGRVCLSNPSCTSTETEQNTTLIEDSGMYSNELTITVAGGYLEITQLAP